MTRIVKIGGVELQVVPGERLLRVSVDDDPVTEHGDCIVVRSASTVLNHDEIGELLAELDEVFDETQPIAAVREKPYGHCYSASNGYCDSYAYVQPQ